MKHVTVLAVFQFTRGENGHPGQGQRAARSGSSFSVCVARQPPEADLFRQSGAHLGVIRRHDGYDRGKFPLAAVFFRGGLMIESWRCRFSIENLWPHSRQTR